MMICTLAPFFFFPALMDQHAATLLERCGDRRFHVREQASDDLHRLVRTEWGHCVVRRLQAAKQHPDAEVARRATRAVEAFYSVEPTEYPAIPWIDMLPESVPGRNQLITDYRQKARTDACFYHTGTWDDYRYATVLYTADLLNAGKSRADVQKLLDEMAAGERKYKARRGMPYDY